MTYTPLATRHIDALSLDDLCDPRFTLLPRPRLLTFGGVADPPETTARIRAEIRAAAELDKYCCAPGCNNRVFRKSRTKTCVEHRHTEFCRCLGCRKVM